MSLEIVPVYLKEARRFVGLVHRHSKPPQGGLFAVGLVDSKNPNQLVGVAIAGRTVSRRLDDGKTIEIPRVATDGTKNACSKLYGAITRAAKALGWERAITYTLQEESGASLKASNWQLDEELPASRGWDQPSRLRVEQDLFGNDVTPMGPKYRWTKNLQV